MDKNQVTMMTAYTPKLPMDILTNKLEEGKKYVTDAIMISKGIVLLNKTCVFPNDVKEWNRKTDGSK